MSKCVLPCKGNSGRIVRETMDRLPYPIPGPAGTLPRLRPQSSTVVPAQPDRFSVLSWSEMRRSLSLPPHGSQRLSSSLALLRRNALLNFRHKLSKLPVIVDSLHWVGHDASVNLVDPTTSMSATIYATVFASYPNTPIRAGTVLILKEAIAFAYSNRSVGFRADPSSAVHLNIRLPHIEAVIPVPEAATPQQPSSCSLADPSTIYSSFAFAPPMPPIRPRRPPSFNSSHLPSNPSIIPQPPTRPLVPHNRHPQPPRAAHKAPFIPPSRKRQFPNTNTPPNDLPTAKKRPASHQFSSSPVPTGPSLIFPKPIVSSGIPITPHQPLRTQSGPTVMAAMSDEHLDSILGDFDLDAAIAAHEKSVPSNEHASSVSLQSTPFGSVGAQTKQNSQGEPAPVSFPAHRHETNDNDSSLATARANSNPPVPRPSENFISSVGQATSSSTPHVPLSAVDDDMIQNLFDGLDASDFG